MENHLWEVVILSTIQNYKCPCCDAPLVFEASLGKMHCEYCGSSFSPETLEQMAAEEKAASEEGKYDWENYTERTFDDSEAEFLATYSCPACGASVTGDNNMGATVCPYCGNATIVKKSFEGTQVPDYVLPFKINKNTAMECFENACKKAPFLPKEFKNTRKIEEMAGVYIPFWMFDCDCNAKISYKAEKVETWSDNNYNYKKTDYYSAYREGTVSFENIPVDGSEKTDNTYMEALEPFNYSEAVNFKATYLSGFLADKYDVDDEVCRPRANERAKRTTETEFSSSVTGYSSVTVSNSSVSFSGGKTRYSLLPVWMLNIKYKDKMYKYAINGQTGKVVGEYPVDKKKKWFYFFKVYMISLAVIAAGYLLFSLI